MGWFNRDNDEDIDDIYNKLDDIYSKLEVLDVVTAFSGRLSRLEKTSSYLEDVLMQTVKDLEKRLESLESKTIFVNTVQGDNSELDNFKLQIDILKNDIQSVKSDLINVTATDDGVNQHITKIDSIIKKLTEKITNLETSNNNNTSISGNNDSIQILKNELAKKDEQINQLNKKIESLTYIIEEDSKNIKLVARHIINQADTMKALQDEIYYLSDKKDKSIQ